jgi:hypothetical protein
LHDTFFASFFATFFADAGIDATMLQDRRRQPERRVRFEEIRAEISERVRAACCGLAADDREALLSRMARVQLKYELAGLLELP